MSELFKAAKPRAHWLKNMKICEVSLVDHPASPGADVVLMKSRSGVPEGEPSWQPIAKGLTAVYAQVDGAPALLGYETMRSNGTLAFEKAGQADGSWPQEKPLRDGETAQDMDREDTKRAKKMRRKQIKKMWKRIAIAKADIDYTDGRSGSGYHSESDRAGIADHRSPDDKAEAANQILAAVWKNPPVESENFSTYSNRLWGSALAQFTSAELAVGRGAYHVLRQHDALRMKAAAALDDMAKSLSAQDGRPFEASFAKACRTEAGQQLYSIMQGAVLKAAEREAYGAMTTEDDTVPAKRAARSVASSGLGNRAHLGDLSKRNDVAEASSMSPSACNAAIKAKADELRQTMGMSATSALIEAARAMPAIYARSRSAQS